MLVLSYWFQTFRDYSISSWCDQKSIHPIKLVDFCHFFHFWKKDSKEDLFSWTSFLWMLSLFFFIFHTFITWHNCYITKIFKIMILKKINISAISIASLYSIQKTLVCQYKVFVFQPFNEVIYQTNALICYFVIF